MTASWVVPTVSAVVGATCLVAAAVIWTLGKRHTPRLVVALAITGMVGLLGTPVGRFLHNLVNRANGLLAHLTGKWLGVSVAFLGAGIVLYFVAIRVHRRQVDDRVVIAAAALPLVVTFIPGTVGALASGAVFGIANAVGYAVGALFVH